MKSPRRPKSLLLIAALMAFAQGATADKAPPISKETKLQVIRLLDNEFVWTRKPLPMGDRALTIKQSGEMTPADEDLKRLVFSFLDDERIGPAFKSAPAAKRLHHAWLGGLLEHVVTLVRVCLATVPFYPEVDADLLVTGAILHDMGKVRELEWKSSFSYTLEGQMIGHISIAQGMLREKVQALAPFPEKLRVLVEHMILSHHGKYEFGSPKLPMTPEAILLSALDDLEAKMQALRNEFAASEAAGKGPDEVTEWVRSMERSLFDSKKYLKDD